MLSLLYGPTLTSVHDYWKNCSFDYMDLCRQRLLYNVMLISTVQQSESAMCIHISPLFRISFPFRSPQSIVVFRVLYSRFSLVTYFIHRIDSVYVSPNLPAHPTLPPFSLGVHSFLLCICVFVSVL